MNEFFKFLFNPEILNNVLRPEWIKLYDMTYIDTKIIGNLLKNSELLSDLLNNIMTKAMGEHQLSKENSTNNLNNSKNSETKKERRKIVPEPFNLTQPKPKVIKEPIKIPNKIPAKEIPYDSFHKNSLQKLDEVRKDRLEIIKESVIKKYESAKTVELKTAKRPTNLEKIAKEISEKRESELQFDKKYHIPLKDFSQIPANVKYNETAILREEYLINKKKKQEEEELNKILIEKKDAKEFERWKREMEERDDLLRMEEITRRKLELDLNREVATEYFNQRILQNKLEAQKHKGEEHRKMQEKMQLLAEELEQKKKLVKEVEKEREIVAEEKEKLIQKNKENYSKQLQEYQDLVLKANEEKRIEEERRKDLIVQIRELERLPMKRTKGFDPTETPGHGLLEEMSLAELRERLEMQKKFVQEFVEAKKEENRLKQAEKNEEFLDKANLVMNYRDQLRNEKEIERKNKMEKKAKEEEMRKQIREKNLLEVKGKIEGKKNKLKKEEEILEKKIREIKLQRQYLQQGRAVVEEKAFKQIEDGLENKINNRQNKDLIEQQLKESVKFGEIKIRYNSAKNEVKEKYNLVKNYEKTFESLKRINNQCVEEDETYKKALYRRERGVAHINKIKRDEKNKYSQNLMLKTAESKETMTKTTSKNMFGSTTMSGFNQTNKSFGETNPLNDKIEKEMN